MQNFIGQNFLDKVPAGNLPFGHSVLRRCAAVAVLLLLGWASAHGPVQAMEPSSSGENAPSDRTIMTWMQVSPDGLAVTLTGGW